MPRPSGMNKASSPLVYDLCRRIEGVNQRVLARRAGLGKTYVSDLRCGRKLNPCVQELEALADAAGYDIVLQPKQGQE